METIIKHYQTLLTCEQFIVTGSLALSKYGLVEPSKVGDLDLLLINPTKETKDLLERLQKDNPADTLPSGGSVSFIFMHEKTKIDIFFEEKKIDNLPLINGVFFNRIDRIIQAKKKSNRLKDWVQLKKMAKLFYEQSSFDKFIDSL